MISSGQNGTSNGTASAAGRNRIQVPAPDSSVNPVELNDLARELTAAFGEMLNSYREHCKLSAEEAAKRAADASPEHIDRILNAPPNDVSWFDLDTLAQKDENLALERWQRIKEAACNEFRSGYRASRAVEDAGGPWERARFLAVRAELMEDWRPRNTTEQLLVDQLAQSQVLMWRWQEAMTTWTNCAISDLRQAKKGKPHETMRLSEAEALERATKKVDLLQRLFLRTLKALQDQRRIRRSALVRRAGQVNIAYQQVNVSGLCATGILDSAV
jgi:hypothetical protein